MIDPLYSMALATGFLGTGHCLGMCGGLVAALALSAENGPRGPLFHLCYNLGRLATYTLIGAAVGWLGSVIAYTDTFRLVSRTILLASDLFVILLGLGTAGLFAGLNVASLEIAGIGQRVSGAVARLRRIRGAPAGLPIGALMGFLPCGWLYAVAFTAAQSASPWRGAAVLFLFGLGTLPGLMAFGSGAHWLGRRLRRNMLRAAGGMVTLMGAYNLFRHGQMLGWW